MNISGKFLFDTSFDAEDLAEDAVQPARKPPPPKFGEEDLERARSEGHARGKEIGAQEALQSIEQQISQAVNAVSAQMSGLAQAQAGSHERREREALEVALTVVRKIFPHLAGRHGLAEVESVVSDCLERLREEPRIVIRVADAVLDQVEARIGGLAARAGFEGNIVYLAQDGLNPGDVRVEWADGGAERDSERLWREIDQITARIVNSGPPPDAPEIPVKASESPEPAPAGPAPSDAVLSA
jgi:flagellar assembly protein FliH